MSGLSNRAFGLAEQMLAEPLPRRWSHSLDVAGRAHELQLALGKDAELMEAAALLHDVGYSPAIATTGFHPLDGARFLRDQEGLDERVVNLVAHHSFAFLEAEERGLREELGNEFPLESPTLVDAFDEPRCWPPSSHANTWRRRARTSLQGSHTAPYNRVLDHFR